MRRVIDDRFNLLEADDSAVGITTMRRRGRVCIAFGRSLLAR
jgi:hypothetical protein